MDFFDVTWERQLNTRLNEFVSAVICAVPGPPRRPLIQTNWDHFRVYNMFIQLQSID
jgi:hypothetical protein